MDGWGSHEFFEYVHAGWKYQLNWTNYVVIVVISIDDSIIPHLGKEGGIGLCILYCLLEFFENLFSPDNYKPLTNLPHSQLEIRMLVEGCTYFFGKYWLCLQLNIATMRHCGQSSEIEKYK